MTHVRDPHHATCFDRAVLADFALGKLPVEELESIVRQVEGCSVCTTALETLDELEDSVIRDLRHRQSSPAGSAGQELELRLRRSEALSRDVWHSQSLETTTGSRGLLEAQEPSLP